MTAEQVRAIAGTRYRTRVDGRGNVYAQIPYTAGEVHGREWRLAPTNLPALLEWITP